MTKDDNFRFIHPNAKIGKNVEIGPMTVIEEDVEIGDGTWIAHGVTIMNGSRIGKNCKIHTNVVISVLPQDLKYAGEHVLTEIGDNTIIREYASVSRGTAASGTTKIGNNCLLMTYSHVSHDCVIEDNCILVSTVQLAGHIEVGEHTIIGGGTVIHQFSKIGKHTMVGGGSVVRKDIPPYAKVAKEPLAFYGVNMVGLRRKGFSTDVISEIQAIYKVLYDGGLNFTKATNLVEEEFPQSEHRDVIIKFFRESDRGVLSN